MSPLVLFPLLLLLVRGDNSTGGSSCPELWVDSGWMYSWSFTQRTFTLTRNDALFTDPTDFTFWLCPHPNLSPWAANGIMQSMEAGEQPLCPPTCRGKRLVMVDVEEVCLSEINRMVAQIAKREDILLTYGVVNKGEKELVTWKNETDRENSWACPRGKRCYSVCELKYCREQRAFSISRTISISMRLIYLFKLLFTNRKLVLKRVQATPRPSTTTTTMETPENLIDDSGNWREHTAIRSESRVKDRPDSLDNLVMEGIPLPLRRGSGLSSIQSMALILVLLFPQY